MPRTLKIIFMGTPDFAVTALDAVVAAGHDVVCVYCQPPRPAGRGQKLQAAPVQTRAEELGLLVRTPVSLKKDAAARSDFAALGADFAVVAAYGLILPQEVLDAPRFGCLNIHASLLPRWRGAAPIQRALLAGDATTGVCIMQMEAGLDTGPVLMRGETPITAESTAAALHDALARLGAELMVQTLARIAAGDPPRPVPQDDVGATYAAMLTKDDGRIDWTKPATEIERQLRALHPWPGVWCRCDGKRLKVLAARVTGASGAPGEIVGRDLTVACGQGAITLTRVQPQDKNPMNGGDFLNGGGARLGEALS